MRRSTDFGLEGEACDREGVTVLAASGDIDMTASREFGRRLQGALRSSSGHVVLDLLEVVHLDSTALRSLLECRKLAEERGARLVLVCARRPVGDVLEITGLAGHFEIAPDRESALESFGRASQPKR